MQNFEQLAQIIANYDLALPSLLFVASHRPCAFVLGQLLYVCAPLAAMVGFSSWQAWAALLSEPDSARQLEKALIRATEGKKGQPQ